MHISINTVYINTIVSTMYFKQIILPYKIIMYKTKLKKIDFKSIVQASRYAHLES